MKHKTAELEGALLDAAVALALDKYKIAANGCWEWSGRRNSLGYGRLVVAGKESRAHRVQFFRHNPSADRSMVVRHRCDNPSCIKPDHLEIGTVKDNVHDMIYRGRFKGGAKPGNGNAVGNLGWLRRAEKEGRLIEYRGERRLLVHWADVLGFNRGTLVCRLRAGWSVERAFSTPSRRYVASKLGEEVELP